MQVCYFLCIRRSAYLCLYLIFLRFQLLLLVLLFSCLYFFSPFSFLFATICRQSDCWGLCFTSRIPYVQHDSIDVADFCIFSRKKADVGFLIELYPPPSPFRSRLACCLESTASARPVSPVYVHT